MYRYVSNSKVIELNFHNCNQVGVLDLENFTVCEVLTCVNVSVESIINFPNTLEELVCSRNLITNLNGLPDELVKMNCSYNKLTKLDNLPMGLRWLDCSHNKITSLEMIPEGLETLTCSSNAITRLEDLPNGLRHLNCELNQIQSINFLPKSLEYLNFSKNKIWKISSLPNKLKFLSGSNNLIEEPVYLDELYELEEVDLSSNRIPSIGTNLADCINLIFLNIEFNCVKKIPVLPNSLTELFCSSNDFEFVVQTDIPEDLEVLGVEDSKINFNPVSSLLLLSNK
jgi:Leucine-rich repeat (LRR) protein